ncbi:MAG TPA: alpha-glucan family phosphorylase, partial [Gaiellaceae bacterium]|nr:alpha-glucan family phosphorylase [Gaiellaceae bacterium]
MTSAPAGTRTSWWERDHGSVDRFRVAYFCMEFGIDEELPVYSGGLGVLAGDHLKAAADLGLPLVGVGLLYRMGYFRQAIDDDGQEERYVEIDPEQCGLTLERGADGTPLIVTVDLAGEQVRVQIWRSQAAGTPLLLLDTDVEGNSELARRITDALYGGDREHRLRQELVLGIGGPRALAALGIEPSVVHVNEGHAAFLALERLRAAVVGGRPRDEALAAIRAATVFTTHTPVPAGNERFARDLVRRYTEGLAADAGLTWDELSRLGSAPGDDSFGLTPLALRTAGRANGVSVLHGEVAREMWAGLDGAAPIGAVTNGVHFATWIGRRLRELLAQAGVELDAPPGEQRWDRAYDIERGALAEVLAEQRRALLARVVPAAGLTPDALTIGFARRFAAYKRAGLIFSDPERLRRLLHDADRPVQLVVAGKAHPADAAGKELIRRVVEYARADGAASRVAFLPDYDIALAKVIVRGVDIWLNTPRRPQEASGTSGMKAALNGAVNVSTLDGWWAEAYAPA